MLGITHIRGLDDHGDLIASYRTDDGGPKAQRALTVRRVELWVVHTTGGAGEAPASHGYLTEEAARTAVDEYMAAPDGRGLVQTWARVK